MLKIVRDASHDILEVVLSGFFDAAEAEQYLRQVKASFLRHAITPGYLMLIDCTECSFQSQAVLSVFAAHIPTFPKARRIAVATGSALVQLQVKRVMTQSYLRIFAHRADAHSWLFSKGDEKAA